MFVFLLCLAGLTFSTVHYFSRWEKGKVLQAARWVHAQSFSGTVVIVPRYLQPLWKYHDRSGLPLVDEAGIDQLTPIIATHTRNPGNHGRTQSRPRCVGCPVPYSQRIRFPAEFHLGLVVTPYANRNGTARLIDLAGC
jgi:hypothetical protein